MKNLFKMGVYYDVSHKTGTSVQVIGFISLLILWTIVTTAGWVSYSILPSPIQVLKSLPELHFQNELIRNIGYSLWINISGYIKAILIALPLGFLISLFPIFRHLFGRYIDALRFLPLTALIGLFIAWFGIYDTMKINFLAFGIIVYLLPLVVLRVSETEKTHVDTIWTLGATNWQQFRYVYFPSAMSKLFDDIRVIVATSWTYVIVIEVINKTGGIGALINMCSRQSRVDKAFACLFIIILIGFLQDRLFKWLDKKLFKHKYVKK